MDTDDVEHLCGLIHEQRWAALATAQDDGSPFVSFVAYAPEPGLTSLLLLVSRLAAHTGYMLARPRVALGISAPDERRDDPQTLPRVTLEGVVEVVAHEAPDYAQARACYLARLPAAEQLFGFADFSLLRLRAESLRYVGGFGRARTVSAARLRQWAETRGL